MTERITERDLILPALWIISKAEGAEVSTTELQQALRKVVQPRGEDLEILEGRNDDKFSQKVRNLRSHQTLEKPGYVNYESREGNGYWRITAKGQEFLDQHDVPFLDYLLTNDFEFDDVKPAIESIDLPKRVSVKKALLFDEEAVINEGKEKTVQQKIYVRSAKLRNAAIAYYSQHERIVCQVCSFDFESTYGDLGKGFIEIHHLKPVYTYEEDDVEQVVREAIKNTIPVCSNCHRMLHRRRDTLLSIEELRQIVNKP